MKPSKIVLYSGVGYALVLFLTPVLTRLYSPDQLGRFAVFSACVMFALPFFALGNDYAIVNEKNISQCKRYFNNLIVSTLFGFILSYVIFFVADYFFGLIDGGYFFLLLFPVAAVLAVLGGAGVNWNIRCGQDDVAGRALLVGLGGRSVIQSLFGFFGFGLRGLIFGEIFGRLISLYFSNRKFYIFRHEISSKFINIVKKFNFNKYSKYVTPKIFIENFIFWSPPFLFSLVYGTEIGGVLAIAQRLGSTPITIYNQAYGIIFHRTLVIDSNLDSRKIIKILIANWSLLALIVLMFAFLLSFDSVYVSVLVFGGGWSDVGYVFLLTMPMYFAQMCVVLVDKLFMYLNYFKAKLLFNIAHASIIIISLICSHFMGHGKYFAIFLMSISVALSYFASMMYVLFILRAGVGLKL